jgi:hypothetical protein
MRERLTAQGRTYQSMDIPQVRLRQLFVQEPNGILFELNFFED